MPTQPNPETHCTSCGEVLSIYHHCWRCHYPPMDSAQDSIMHEAPACASNTTTALAASADQQKIHSR